MASPYLFLAADHPLTADGPGLRVREAVTPYGIALRYQERAPDPENPDLENADPEKEGGAQAAPHWCETGHSIFVVSGRIRYTFVDHVVEAGPGDMLHIPAGPAHRHQPSVPGPEPARYFLTEFG